MHTDKPRLMKAQNDIPEICYTILHLKILSINTWVFQKNVIVYYEIYEQ